MKNYNKVKKIIKENQLLGLFQESQKNLNQKVLTILLNLKKIAVKSQAENKLFKNWLERKPLTFTTTFFFPSL